MMVAKFTISRHKEGESSVTERGYEVVLQRCHYWNCLHSQLRTLSAAGIDRGAGGHATYYI